MIRQEPLRIQFGVLFGWFKRNFSLKTPTVVEKFHPKSRKVEKFTIQEIFLLEKSKNSKSRKVEKFEKFEVEKSKSSHSRRFLLEKSKKSNNSKNPKIRKVEKFTFQEISARKVEKIKKIEKFEKSKSRKVHIPIHSRRFLLEKSKKTKNSKSRKRFDFLTFCEKFCNFRAVRLPARGALRLHGRPVLRQEVPKRRGKDARCFGVFQIRPEGIADEKPPGLERVEKNNASSKQAAYPQAPYVWNCNEAFLQGVQGHGSKGAHRFRPLPVAGGRACLESQEHTSARNGGRGTVQDDHHSDPRLRVRGSRQGGSVRQCTSTRQSRDVLDRGIPFAAEPQAEEPGGPDFSVYHGRVSKAVHGCWEGSWGGGSPPLPAPTWRSISGSEFWLERPQWSEKQRAVEDGPECAPLCKDWQGSAAVDEAIPQHSAVLPVVRGKHGKSFPRNCASSRNVKLSVVHQPFPDIFTMNSRPRRFCIEIFAGAARISTALKNVGLQAFPIDICFFPSHNVLRKDVEFSIQNFLRSGRVEFVWLGMPYTTFSRARRDDGIGPLPLRSSEHIWGLPELNPCQLRKLRDGNALFLFSMRILRLCTELRIPYVIENPETGLGSPCNAEIYFHNACERVQS